jgi:putative IMPACT (imprinted ancient) family translation regulator
MEFLLKKELDNVALIVIRYFGGTKLGAGRLLRTYVQAGVNVVNSAQIVEKE